jgi:hypothetical protein
MVWSTELSPSRATCARWWPRLADEGFPRQVEQVTTGYLEELQARIGWSLQHGF